MAGTRGERRRSASPRGSFHTRRCKRLRHMFIGDASECPSASLPFQSTRGPAPGWYMRCSRHGSEPCPCSAPAPRDCHVLPCRRSVMVLSSGAWAVLHVSRWPDHFPITGSHSTDTEHRHRSVCMYGSRHDCAIDWSLPSSRKQCIIREGGGQQGSLDRSKAFRNSIKGTHSPSPL